VNSVRIERPLLELRAATLWAAALVAAAISWFVFCYGYIEDDAFIHLEFARSLAGGQGFAFNGHVVYGDTAPLWVFILALFGAAVAAFSHNLPPQLRARVLAVQAMIGVGFLLFILLTSNPFLRLLPVPADGAGLNPILQDPGLAFHPPWLYLGYVGFSISFCFAIAALIEGRVDPAWARWVRPWTLAAWLALTIGIAMGSWWAYYTLGWGGWWYWDPVENASFMPWLVGTALLHSAIVVEKREALKTWTILLAIITFSLSLIGTFLVRSGVLTSVHAFAMDPARGAFILLLLIGYTGGAFLLFAIRAPSLVGGGLFAPMSREGGLLLNNLLLTTAAATVLLGTLYPLFLDVLTGQKVSVGPPYFNLTFGPIMVPLIMAMAVGPLLPWKRADLWAALGRLKLAFAVTAAAAVATLMIAGVHSIGAACGLGLAAWLFAATMIEWAERVRLFSEPSGAKLTYTVTQANGQASPPWLAFNASTRTFSGTVPAGSAFHACTACFSVGKFVPGASAASSPTPMTTDGGCRTSTNDWSRSGRLSYGPPPMSAARPYEYATSTAFGVAPEGNVNRPSRGSIATSIGSGMSPPPCGLA